MSRVKGLWSLGAEEIENFLPGHVDICLRIDSLSLFYAQTHVVVKNLLSHLGSEGFTIEDPRHAVPRVLCHCYLQFLIECQECWGQGSSPQPK